MIINRNEWSKIVRYLLHLNEQGIRKHVCPGCGISTLYDLENKAYKVTAAMTVDQVRQIVETIKQANDTIRNKAAVTTQHRQDMQPH